MLDLAQFRGLTAKILANVPAVAYFHENQLTYPVRAPHERDLHFAFTNFMTAVAADQIWFNSAFHRGEFLDAVTKWLRKMPDFVPDQEAVLVRKKSVVQSPGIDDLDRRRARISGPLRIAWAARWEHDKNPEVFFDGSPYQLSQCLSTLSNDVSLLNRPAQVHVLTAAADRYRWPRRAAAMDDSLERIANRCLM